MCVFVLEQALSVRALQEMVSAKSQETVSHFISTFVDQAGRIPILASSDAYVFSEQIIQSVRLHSDYCLMILERCHFKTGLSDFRLELLLIYIQCLSVSVNHLRNTLSLHKVTQIAVLRIGN